MGQTLSEGIDTNGGLSTNWGGPVLTPEVTVPEAIPEPTTLSLLALGLPLLSRGRKRHRI